MSVPNEDHAALAREFLRMAHQNYQTHYAQRVYFARISREHGLTNREIAETAHLSTHTIESHTKSIYRKLKVNSRAEATLEAARLGLVSPGR